MADAVVAAVTSGLASAVVGGALTYVTAVLKIRRDLAAQYDADLRRDRITVAAMVQTGAVGEICSRKSANLRRRPRPGDCSPILVFRRRRAVSL